MSDQKELKKRLKVLMNLPENQVCSDCPERQPRWASLIVPPPGAPPGSLPIGAFCCLECSGSHRRLGVHISFVRSINLDSWKEKEVQAMENGGNDKVNAIFEARLQGSGSSKPSKHADGSTRERFIRDKYERRKFYDAAAFQRLPQEPAPVPSMPRELGRSNSGGPVAPSDAARQRVEERRAKQQQQQQQFHSSTGSLGTGKPKGPRRTSSSSSGRGKRGGGGSGSKNKEKPAAAPISAPVQFDLLDLTSDPAHSHVPPPSSAVPDLLRSSSGDQSVKSKSRPSKSAAKQHGSPPPPPPPPKTSSEDILSLYNNTNSINLLMSPKSQPLPFVVANGGGNSNNAGMMGMNQQGSINSMPNMTSMMQNMNLQQQQALMYQQQMMMQMQQNQMGNQAMNNFGAGMLSNVMVAPQQNQQQHQGNGSFSYPSQLHQKSAAGMMMMQQQQQPGMMMNQGGMGGFNSPMGGSDPTMSAAQVGGGGGKRSGGSKSSPEKKDPFAQFETNVFRS